MCEISISDIKKIPKPTEKNKNVWIRTETDRNRQKLAEMYKKIQKRTETGRNGQKQKQTNRNRHTGQKQTDTDKNTYPNLVVSLYRFLNGLVSMHTYGYILSIFNAICRPSIGTYYNGPKLKYQLLSGTG